MKVKVKAFVKGERFPVTWGKFDFKREAEAEVDVPVEALQILKAGGWLVDPSIVPVPVPPPSPPPLPPVPDRRIVNKPDEEP